MSTLLQGLFSLLQKENIAFTAAALVARSSPWLRAIRWQPAGPAHRRAPQQHKFDFARVRHPQQRGAGDVQKSCRLSRRQAGP
ncbi:MAG: hypothetical protein WCS94_22350, partial [Verrucomicrobiota bacterium]